MDLEIPVDERPPEAVTELERAVRDNQHLEIADRDPSSVRLVGDAGGIDQLTRALWVREITARKFGQHSLAAADQTIRVRVQQAARTGTAGSSATMLPPPTTTAED